ncbi:MAG: MurT ligase domain-containing protein [Bacillota bacterium]|nr:MurT ligase domain-containing protein [Bacillota bacterium]
MKYIALIIGKVLVKLLKALGRNGGSFPGQIAIKFCKNLLEQFQYPKITLLVTGTNGKTSTSNLIAKSFERDGYRTISNSRGDNMVYGILTLFIRNADFRFRVKADVAVIEIDELTLARYFSQMDVSDLVVTNFFRDQLDRAGEMESIVSKIEAAVRDYTGRLYLNEDDPNVKRLSYAATEALVRTYGMGTEPSAEQASAEAREGKFCPLCKKELVYEYFRYSHIGSYRCTGCRFASDRADYTLKELFAEDCAFELRTKDGRLERFSFNLNASYHFYNLLAAASALLENRVRASSIDAVFAKFQLGIGRMETIQVGGERILLNLVKNPTGCNEIIKYIEAQGGEKALLFLLNDNEQDGTDTSWIWDAEFEALSELKRVILTGKRAAEAAIRFKLAGVSADIAIEKDVKKALQLLLAEERPKYMISTYTGIFSSREILFALRKEREA